jgi:CheY-like chemotaxis protein
MARVRLVHWNEAEGLARQKQLEALGFDVQFEFSDGASIMRAIRASAEPDAVVVDMSRLPSHGREVGRVVRMSKASRQWPLVFVDGEPAKIAQTKALLPDATYTTWGRIKPALTKAIARPLAAPVVPKDTMSGKPPVEKLGVKPGFTVALLGSPKGFADTLKPLPKKVTFTARPDAGADLFICFARTAREMHAQFLALKATVDRQSLWMIWPKKASGIKSDLDGNVVREGGLAAGWVDYKVCAVDDTWSGLAFKKRK